MDICIRLIRTGRASKNMANFAAYINAGYDAVKAVYPEAKVIVHLDKGNNLGITWNNKFKLSSTWTSWVTLHANTTSYNAFPSLKNSGENIILSVSNISRPVFCQR